jgi:hypothetical protein
VSDGGAIGTAGAGLSGCADAGGGEITGGEAAIALRCSLCGGTVRKCLDRGSTTRSGRIGIDPELSALDCVAASLDTEGG